MKYCEENFFKLVSRKIVTNYRLDEKESNELKKEGYQYNAWHQVNNIIHVFAVQHVFKCKLTLKRNWSGRQVT